MRCEHGGHTASGSAFPFGGAAPPGESRNTQGLRDDDGVPTEAALEVFSGLPNPPDNWDQADGPLHFELRSEERRLLREKLGRLVRADGKKTLLARLADAAVSIDGTPDRLPADLDDYADAEDRTALGIARDMAAPAAIGWATSWRTGGRKDVADGGADDRTFRTQLESHIAKFGQMAGRCDLSKAKHPANAGLSGRCSQANAGICSRRRYPRPVQVFGKATSTRRSGEKESGLALPPPSVRPFHREDWRPERHNTTPLHYRWEIVSDMLMDLSSRS